MLFTPHGFFTIPLCFRHPTQLLPLPPPYRVSPTQPSRSHPPSLSYPTERFSTHRAFPTRANSSFVVSPTQLRHTPSRARSPTSPTFFPSLTHLPTPPNSPLSPALLTFVPHLAHRRLQAASNLCSELAPRPPLCPVAAVLHPSPSYVWFELIHTLERSLFLNLKKQKSEPLIKHL